MVRGNNDITLSIYMCSFHHVIASCFIVSFLSFASSPFLAFCLTEPTTRYTVSMTTSVVHLWHSFHVCSEPPIIATPNPRIDTSAFIKTRPLFDVAYRFNCVEVVHAHGFFLDVIAH
jgi:hypothetical protein